MRWREDEERQPEIDDGARSQIGVRSRYSWFSSCSAAWLDFWKLDPFPRRRAVRRGAEILDWPAHWETEVAGHGKRPVRLAQEFAGEEYHVGFVPVQDGIGLAALVIMPTAPVMIPVRWRILVGKRNLVARADGNLALPAPVPPEEQSMRSTPSGISCSASATDCSMSQPPSTQSVAEMRTKSGSFRARRGARR